MRALSFKGHRIPPDVIRHAVWLYFRFSLSLRDVEELLAQRGIDVSYETVRCWTIMFGPLIARRLLRLRVAPCPTLASRRNGLPHRRQTNVLWRAVDDEGEVLDLVVQHRRDTGAALQLLNRLLRSQSVPPEAITTDGLASYGAALRQVGLGHLHRRGHLRDNNRAENSHLPIRRRRATDAVVQEQAIGSAFPHHPCSDLQHLLQPAPSDQSPRFAHSVPKPMPFGTLPQPESRPTGLSAAQSHQPNSTKRSASAMPLPRGWWECHRPDYRYKGAER